MKIFATPEFKHEFEKLIKKNSYKYLSEEIIEKYFDKNISDVLDGTKLNGNAPNPFIKKRIGGRGASRLYLLIIQTSDSIYFAFVHPKTKPAGYDNISTEKKTQLLDDTYDCIGNNDLYEISHCEARKNIIFSKPKVKIELIAAE